MIVDDWEEVCRENTNIEIAHKQYGLKKEHTFSLSQIILSNYFKKLDPIQFLEQGFALFNPMGMALFDLALAKYYYEYALEKNVGLRLDE